MNHEREWELRMREAASFEMPKQLRRTFVDILVFGSVKNPVRVIRRKKLFQAFLYEMFEEDMWDRQGSEERRRARALYHINSILRLHGLCLENFGLPSIDETALHGDPEPLDVRPLSKQFDFFRTTSLQRSSARKKRERSLPEWSP